MNDEIVTDKGTFECKLETGSEKFYLNRNQCMAYEMCIVTDLNGNKISNGMKALDSYFKKLRKLANGGEQKAI